MHDLVGMDHRVQRPTSGRRRLPGLGRCGRLDTVAVRRLSLGQSPAWCSRDAPAGGASLTAGLKSFSRSKPAIHLRKFALRLPWWG